MRNIDLSAFYRSAIGFERLSGLFSQFAQSEHNPSYPPYNIEQLSETLYRISMAVAGFSEKDLDIELHQNKLKIRGRKQEDSTKREFLYRGIASRAFEHNFEIADNVQVKGAFLKNGLLHVDLLRKLPEEDKVKKINIMADETLNSSHQVEEHLSTAGK